MNLTTEQRLDLLPLVTTSLTHSRNYKFYIIQTKEYGLQPVESIDYSIQGEIYFNSKESCQEGIEIILNLNSESSKQIINTNANIRTREKKEATNDK